MASPLRLLAKAFCLEKPCVLGWGKQKVFLKNDRVNDEEKDGVHPCPDVDDSAEALFLSRCMLSGRVLATG